MERKTRFSRGATFGILLVLFAVTPVIAKRYMTTEFRTTEARPQSMAVLPPHAEFIKQKAVMTEEMIKECKALEDISQGSIVEILQDKGYTVRVVTVEEINADAQLQEMVRRVNKRYNDEWRHILRKPRKVKVGRYGIGELAREIAAALGVDGIVIPRIQAVGVTGGKVAMTAILSGGSFVAQGYARLDLSVVDGETGRVEGYFWYLRRASLKSLTQKPDKLMANVTKKTLKKYPESSEVLSAKRSSKDDEPEDEEDAKGESAILGELEALLGPDESVEPEKDEP